MGPRRGDRDVRRGRPRLRAPARDRPSRRQAREHHPHERRDREDHGLRDREDRDLEPHGDRPVPRDAELHVARAGDGRGRGRAERPLLARRRALRAPHEEEALHRRQPHVDLVQDRPRGVPRAADVRRDDPGRVRPDPRAGSREGPGGALPEREGLPRGARGVPDAPRRDGDAPGPRRDGRAGREPRPDLHLRVQADARSPRGPPPPSPRRWAPAGFGGGATSLEDLARRGRSDLNPALVGHAPTNLETSIPDWSLDTDALRSPAEREAAQRLEQDTPEQLSSPGTLVSEVQRGLKKVAPPPPEEPKISTGEIQPASRAAAARTRGSSSAGRGPRVAGVRADAAPRRAAARREPRGPAHPGSRGSAPGPERSGADPRARRSGSPAHADAGDAAAHAPGRPGPAAPRGGGRSRSGALTPSHPSAGRAGGGSGASRVSVGLVAARDVVGLAGIPLGLAGRRALPPFATPRRRSPQQRPQGSRAPRARPAATSPARSARAPRRERSRCPLRTQGRRRSRRRSARPSTSGGATPSSGPRSSRPPRSSDALVQRSATIAGRGADDAAAEEALAKSKLLEDGTRLLGAGRARGSAREVPRARAPRARIRRGAQRAAEVRSSFSRRSRRRSAGPPRSAPISPRRVARARRRTGRARSSRRTALSRSTRRMPRLKDDPEAAKAEIAKQGRAAQKKAARARSGLLKASPRPKPTLAPEPDRRPRPRPRSRPRPPPRRRAPACASGSRSARRSRRAT